MSVNIQYIASSGNVYNLKSNGILTKEANYHSWGWVPNGTQLQYGRRISNFTRDAAVYKTELLLYGSPTYRKSLVESLHEDFELDVRNETPGRIIWGSYYIDCYVTDSSTAADENEKWTSNEISFYCPYPFWIKEETKSFFPQEAPAGQTFLDYPFGYDYDYFYGTPGIARWITDFPFSSQFKLTLYGAVVNPRVLINNHPYQVNITLTADEYVVIDSRKNTVEKFSAGQIINVFDDRNKAQSVFQPMPPGTLKFNWTGGFGFDLTLFEERSEPRS